MPNNDRKVRIEIDNLTEAPNNDRKVRIEIDNLTEAQAIALEDMMAQWVSLGNQGASRWTAFFADGDGNFRPKIKIGRVYDLMTTDGPKMRDPQLTDLISRDQKWVKNEYRIDFDAIAWKLRAEREPLETAMKSAVEKLDTEPGKWMAKTPAAPVEIPTLKSPCDERCTCAMARGVSVVRK